MANRSNTVSRFWRELKRRKVVQVITGYGAISFVILQLVNMIAHPLKLPEWTEALVIILLGIGFVLAVFLSWIYDITPAGIKKTRSARDTTKSISHQSKTFSRGWIIATFTSIALVIAMAVFSIVIKRDHARDQYGSEKSIAVLPFKLLSDKPEEQYIADGVMGSINLHLQKFGDMRVIPNISVEQYKGTSKTSRTIGKELKVKFLLSGSFQKFGNDVKLIVQLIVADEERNLWGKEYESTWNKIFSLESEVAQTIARELYATITPEEKELIEKIPTTNMTAYDLFLKANDYQKDFMKDHNIDFYNKALVFYKAALELDATFAKAYSGLASLYLNRHYWETYFKENYLDSCFVLGNMALSFDRQLDEAYHIVGRYYFEKGNIEEALVNFDKALEINPNYYNAYSYKGYLLTSAKSDYVEGINCYQKALNLGPRDDLPDRLSGLAFAYLDVGFIEKAEDYFKQAFILDGNKGLYLSNLSEIKGCLEDFEAAIKLGNEASEIDSAYYPASTFFYGPVEHNEEAFSQAKKLVRSFEKSGELNLTQSHRIGYAFWKAGNHKEAESYFKQQIKYSQESIKLNRSIAQTKAAHYDLAGTYAFLGDKQKAYQYLDEFNKRSFYPLWWISLAKNDPLFDSIRKEERFQGILKNMESRYQAEHDRVKKWLEAQEGL